MEEEKSVQLYQKLCDDWAEKFLRMDTAELMKKTSSGTESRKTAHSENRAFWRAIWSTGKQTAGLYGLDGKEEKPDATEMLNIYTLAWLCERPGAFLMDKWVPFADLRNARRLCTCIQDWCDRCV